MSSAPKQILDLVERFEKNLEFHKNKIYNKEHPYSKFIKTFRI